MTVNLTSLKFTSQHSYYSINTVYPVDASLTIIFSDDDLNNLEWDSSTQTYFVNGYFKYMRADGASARDLPILGQWRVDIPVKEYIIETTIRTIINIPRELPYYIAPQGYAMPINNEWRVKTVVDPNDIRYTSYSVSFSNKTAKDAEKMRFFTYKPDMNNSSLRKYLYWGNRLGKRTFTFPSGPIPLRGNTFVRWKWIYPDASAYTRYAYPGETIDLIPTEQGEYGNHISFRYLQTTLESEWVISEYQISSSDSSVIDLTSSYTYDLNNNIIISGFKSSVQKRGFTWLNYKIIKNTDPAISPTLFTTNSFTIPKNAIGDIVINSEYQINTYSITYNHVVSNHTNPATYNIETTINLTNPSPRQGYRFLGWYNAQTGGSMITQVNGNKNTIGSVTVYARWEALTYNIYFRNKYTNRNNSVVNALYSSTTGIFGSAIMPPDTNLNNEPKKNVFHNQVFRFIGWHTNPDATIPLDNLGVVGSSALTFYAIYSLQLNGVLNSLKNSNLMIGESQVKKAFIGNNLIWEEKK